MKIKSTLQKIAWGLSAIALLEFTTAKAKEDIDKIVAELTYEDDNSFFKFRPFDYTSGTQRNDFLIGKKFSDFVVWGYWKKDNKSRSWIGTRIDYGKKALDNRLSGNLQLRFFKGLGKTKNQIYFIPSFDYKIRNLSPGILGYGVGSKGTKTCFYLGPQINFRLGNHISTGGAYTKDVFSNSKMIYWKANYTFHNKKPVKKK